MQEPKISILIPAYNAAQHIADTVASALCQRWKNTEVIVVDDGSADQTLSVVRSFSDARLRVISQPNQGAAAARNTAFQACEGDYIQYLDADDLLEAGKLEEQMKKVQQWGDAYVYASSWGVFYDSAAQATFHPNILWQDYDSPVDWLVNAWTQQVWMQPGAWLVPRKIMAEAGGWNEKLSLHDDGEFFCRVLLQSRGIRFCDSARAYYRQGNPASLSNSFSEKAIISHLSICALYEKHLLAAENSARTRRACATNYAHFHYAHYPAYKSYRLQALQACKRLGGTDSQPQGTDLFHLIKRVAGWRMARRMENFYYRKGAGHTLSV